MASVTVTVNSSVTVSVTNRTDLVGNVSTPEQFETVILPSIEEGKLEGRPVMVLLTDGVRVGIGSTVKERSSSEKVFVTEPMSEMDIEVSNMSLDVEVILEVSLSVELPLIVEEVVEELM